MVDSSRAQTALGRHANVRGSLGKWRISYDGRSVLKEIGGLVAWVSGSIAGISAVLYAIGFLATKSSESVLGIGLDFTDQDHFTLVARGASVIARTAIYGVWPALALIGLVRLGRWAIGRWRGEGAEATLAAMARYLVPVAAVAILVIVFLALRFHVADALGVKGMLFTAPAVAEACPVDDLRLAVLAQNVGVLQSSFAAFALWIGLLAGIAIVIRGRIVAPENRFWLFVAGTGTGLALIATPLAYGAQILEKKAAPVVLAPAPADDPGAMRLLSRAGDGILVWLEDRHEVRWIARANVSEMTIGPAETIRVVGCPEDTSKGG